MEVKFEREVIEREHEEDSVQTIVFTAGTVLVMLGLKRFLVEQWRAWVFLILNLILLAILFMSMRPSCWVMSQEGKIWKIKKKSASGCAQEAEAEAEAETEKEKECCKEQYSKIDEENEKEEEIEEEEEEEGEVSKEELNERVEAFITMFRQHLVSDAKQAESFRFQKHSTTPRGFSYSSVLL
ncbi:hypothetical protein L6164_005900 [Bauhinia variegata]|uniref:Uncharacterized protein n=1 Tax=Bauhinia variegata TaxID=167791 RepID=A0ACB9PSQ1_BAUVA|nr:hypothetical protein L6164_005900 [Bauhinia variegata]